MTRNGTFASWNSWFISVTAERSHDPIGPCGPLEQSVDIFRHSAMAAWSSSLDFGAQPVVRGHKRVYTIPVRARVGIMCAGRIRVMVRVRNSVSDRVRGLADMGGLGLER